MTTATVEESLKSRAKALRLVRSFFLKHNVHETDPPFLSFEPSIDAHIDPIETASPKRYLHTSPEYRMKELLALSGLDLYFLGHVFRKEEKGELHNEEFTMIEWYRRDCSLSSFIEENLELVSLFINEPSRLITTYDEVSFKHLGTTYADCKDALSQAKQKGAIVHTKEEAWDVLFSELVQPHLGKKCIEVVTDFPPAMAALSQIKNGKAQRFEIFYNGIELGNGYLELWDPILQRERMEHENAKRAQMSKKELPYDNNLIEALKIFRSYCGIALGFDRLLMLKEKKSSIHTVTFPSTLQSRETV